MELLLIPLGVLLVVSGCTILVLLVILARERRRADTAEERADEKISTALMHANDRLRQQEKELRADAIKKSTAVVKGKVAEQLVPFAEVFPFNPRDARFLGSPIDLLVFAGLTEGELDRVVFIEVKTGKSRLSRRERQLRDIIDAGEVYWEEIRL